MIRYGASPRGTLALDAAARARAWLNDRDYVTPLDIQAVFHDVLRHRVLVSYEAEAEGMSSEDILTTILDVVPVP
jgi:MoxR-like ATPase